MNKFFRILTVGLICLSTTSAYAAKSCDDKKATTIIKAQKYLDKSLEKQRKLADKHANKLTSIENARANAIARSEIKETACIKKVTDGVAGAVNCGIGIITGLFGDGTNGTSTRACGKLLTQAADTAACYAKSEQQQDAINKKYDSKVASENANYARKSPLAVAAVARYQGRLDEANAISCAAAVTPTPVATPVV